MGERKDDPKGELKDIDYGECSKEELLRFLRLRDKTIGIYREDLPESSFEQNERIKSLQKENMRLSEKLKNIFDEDIVYAINNIAKDIESGHRVEVSILDEENNVRAITTVGAIAKGERPDKIYVSYMDFEPNDNLVIIDEYKIPFIGVERYYYYKDDSYRTVYYGIILLKKEKGRNILIFTVVTDYFLRKRRSALMKVSNFTGNMGSYNRKVLKKRIEKLKSKRYDNRSDENKKKEPKK